VLIGSTLGSIVEASGDLKAIHVVFALASIIPLLLVIYIRSITKLEINRIASAQMPFIETSDIGDKHLH
jgi:hypothetical protein